MIDVPDRLTGQHVRLIAVDAERDGDLFARWSTDADFMRRFDTDAARPFGARRVRAAEERYAYRDGVYEWAIGCIADDAVIGRIGFHRYRVTHRSADIHIGIGDAAYRGRGLGREAMALAVDYAFREMDLHRVGLTAFANNEPAVRLYRKLGFVEEGSWRQFLRRDGVNHDVIVMGILRTEWSSPGEIAVRRIHHVQLCVGSGDLDRARAFYLGGLGLREVEKPASLATRGGFWAEVDGQQVHISVEDGIDRAQTRAHVAWQVTGLAEWRAKLEAAGCATLDSIPIPGYDRFETRDPFGNRVEFIQAG